LVVKYLGDTLPFVKNKEYEARIAYDDMGYTYISLLSYGVNKIYDGIEELKKEWEIIDKS
jgi:hypothetical protein